jgi:hypothetical protein
MMALLEVGQQQQQMLASRASWLRESILCVPRG